jgi:hypothetical protein
MTSTRSAVASGPMSGCVPNSFPSSRASPAGLFERPVRISDDQTLQRANPAGSSEDRQQESGWQDHDLETFDEVVPSVADAQRREAQVHLHPMRNEINAIDGLGEPLDGPDDLAVQRSRAGVAQRTRFQESANRLIEIADGVIDLHHRRTFGPRIGERVHLPAVQPVIDQELARTEATPDLGGRSIDL